MFGWWNCGGSTPHGPGETLQLLCLLQCLHLLLIQESFVLVDYLMSRLQTGGSGRRWGMDTSGFSGTSFSVFLFFSWNISFSRVGFWAVDRFLSLTGQFGHVSCAQFEANGSEQTLDLVVRLLSLAQVLGYSFSWGGFRAQWFQFHFTTHAWLFLCQTYNHGETLAILDGSFMR